MTLGLVITGTRGAGKTTLAELLLRESGTAMRRVPSFTTRPPRADDLPGTYRFGSAGDFARLQADGQLVLVGSYGAFQYGIAVSDIESVLRAGWRPLLTVAPRQAYGLLAGPSGAGWAGAFVDAADEVLDERLAADGRPADAQDQRQRQEDRRFARPPLALVPNDGSVTEAMERLLAALGAGAGPPTGRTAVPGGGVAATGRYGETWHVKGP
ncbi:hypothetical protein [Catellatospora tritici]|uniref:hypothetical protein n=1 Tax=Catellatospora tritici TaxID=2851566 RepID=UPI001C2CEA14|nr:hypothetical protein [Catellatospora tritici]MBV1849557.1 hypothetical protein [Catellatospora tritici]